MVVGCQPNAPAAFTPQEILLLLISEVASTPGPQCDRKDFMAMKNPPKPDGIEPTTFRFVAQHLNHCATAVPTRIVPEIKTETKGILFDRTVTEKCL